MVIGGLPVTLATGPRACGKTTMLGIIAKLAHCDSVIFGDTSGIIDLHIKRETSIGKRLAEYRKDRASGKIIRNDALILEAIRQWIAWMNRNNTVKHVLLGGSPRSKEQSQFWKKYSSNSRVLHITIKDFGGILEGIKLRQKESGDSRTDESIESLQTAWNDYNELVVPGLKVFNGHVLNLDRSEPLLTRVEAAINHIYLPESVRKKWLHRLHTRDNPTRIEIERLDSQRN
jgi:adenylate kinase family enzyme